MGLRMIPYQKTCNSQCIFYLRRALYFGVATNRYGEQLSADGRSRVSISRV